MENASEDVLTVLDEDGASFIRIDRSGVEANVRSRTWKESGRQRSTDLARDDEGGLASWKNVGRSARYGWIDPRLSPRDGVRASTAWQVPVLLGREPIELTGLTEWRRVEAVADNRQLAP